MCTVVSQWQPGRPLRILAIRDEFVARAFDDPGAWWPDRPGVVGGRDRLAGGTWCASDVASGVSALVLNRVERRTGTPSRGVLPLAALAAGADWPAQVDVRDMAAFNLVLAGPAGVTVWTWDTTELRRAELAAGTHVVTSAGVDADDAKTTAFAPRFAAEPWLEVVTGCVPSAERGALIVRRDVPEGTYATVFGQLITAAAGDLSIAYSRSPWQAGSWVERSWR